MPIGNAIPGVSAEGQKIDDAATDGLTGVVDSIAYRIHEVERHFHAWERWFGAASVPSGETHVADRIGVTGTAFQTDAGNDDWGAWIQILGSDDTPADSGQAEYDLHRLQVVALERSAAPHFMQVAQGASAAVALSAGTFTEFVFHPQGRQGQRVPIPVWDRRQSVGTKAWARIMVPGENTATMDFFFGLHEYEG